jgi:hypothetical protein
MNAMASAGGLGLLGAALLQAGPVALASGLLLATCFGVWLRGTYRAAHALAVFDALAEHLGLVRCEPNKPNTRSPERRSWFRQWFSGSCKS